MQVDLFLTAGQRKTQDAQGTFIYVERAPGWVQVETIPNGYVYDLPPRGQIILPAGEQFERLNITNDSRIDGDVELSVGFGQYIPSSSGQVVTIDNVLTPVGVEVLTPIELAAPAVQAVSEKPCMGMSTPEHVKLAPLEVKRIVATNPARKELVIHQMSYSKTLVMLGDRNVSAVSGLPCIGSKELGGGTVLSGGFEVWAYNDSTEPAKLALMEVLL